MNKNGGIRDWDDIYYALLYIYKTSCYWVVAPRFKITSTPLSQPLDNVDGVTGC